jgi:hypothetical protein
VADFDDLFARARAVSIVAAAAHRGSRLRQRGEQARGPCPLCGGGEKSGSEPFSARVREGLWKCHACGASGDVIEFERLAGGHDGPLSAARALVGDIALPASAARPVPARPPKPAETLVDTVAIARVILAESVPAAGTIVEQWLWARGLDPHALPGGLGDGRGGAAVGLRFHPACPTAQWAVDGQPQRRAPAMVAPVAGPSALAWPACHVTYLAADGRAKANLGSDREGRPRPARKMFGRVGGGAVWLCRSVGANPLVVGEGIESAWALGTALGARSVVATLSLDNLQGGAVRGPGGELMLPARADPARPPFLVPGARDVVIGIDADMAPVRARVMAGGAACETVLDQRMRAELCAQLATQHWRRAGAAPRAWRPAWGQDFNDAAAAAQLGDR